MSDEKCYRKCKEASKMPVDYEHIRRDGLSRLFGLSYALVLVLLSTYTYFVRGCMYTVAMEDCMYACMHVCMHLSMYT